MKTIDIIKKANSNLKRNKLRTLLTITAVFIGAFTLTLTNGVGSGFKDYFSSLFSNVGSSDTLFISKPINIDLTGTKIQKYDGSPKSNTGISPMTTADLTKLNDVKGLTNIQRGYDVLTEYIRSDSGQDKEKYKVLVAYFNGSLDLGLEAGSLDGGLKDQQIILNVPYTKALGFATPADSIGKEVAIQVKSAAGLEQEFKLRVQAVMSNPLVENGSLYVPQNTIRAMNEFQTAGNAVLQDTFTTASANLEPGLSEAQKDEVKIQIKDRGLEGQTLEDAVGGFSKIIDGFRVALNGFGAIALLAASFGIVNTLFMAVHERTKEIGLFKALGMSRRSVFQMFSLEAALIGFWGSVLGSLAGYGLGTWLNSYLKSGPFKDLPGLELSFSLSSAAVIVLIITVIALISGVLPARRASKLDPIEALRYE